jgi:membrane-bound metal-dependent hydrolase YbcI (DUF457 family)
LGELSIAREHQLLVAHLVPGYFATVLTQPHWRPEWGRDRRTSLWIAALGATVVPDTDVVLNVLSGSYINHSTLWTHSLFVHLSVASIWLLLWRKGRWPYLTMLVGLVTLGGLSHLMLDIIAHGTPLLYPLSSTLIGLPSERVVKGGLWAYLSDPIFLLEPALIALAMVHWIVQRRWSSRLTKWAVGSVVGVALTFGVIFLIALPRLQGFADRLMLH